MVTLETGSWTPSPGTSSSPLVRNIPMVGLTSRLPGGPPPEPPEKQLRRARQPEGGGPRSRI
eukprot:8432847-Alexandrium_andersonii.AAC.1